jgi:hypothetical protein
MLRLRTRKEAQPEYEPKLWHRFFEFFVRNKCNAIFVIPPGDSNDLGRHIDDAQHGDAKHKPETRHMSKGGRSGWATLLAVGGESTAIHIKSKRERRSERRRGFCYATILYRFFDRFHRGRYICNCTNIC